MTCEWSDKVFSVGTDDFAGLALEIFRFQYRENPVYRLYVDTLGLKPGEINKLEKIPFLPIGFFKNHSIKTGSFEAGEIFQSSGTTQMVSSKHYVKDVSLYIESFKGNFERQYGKVNEFCILGLLPSYLEKGSSSLVYMVDWLIRNSNHSNSGFYLSDHEKLNATLKMLERQNQKTILIGVTYALLDFAEKFPMHLEQTIIMETGGMKGRKKEMTRMEVHTKLKKAFTTKEIHAEYGMTELLSQAYAKKDGMFYCPPWMKVMVRDEEDPFLVRTANKMNNQDTISGAMNIIDLANVYSCSFIATDDLGKLYPDEGLEILGRMDGSELRGCSLLTI